jgi:hypothetical protein
VGETLTMTVDGLHQCHCSQDERQAYQHVLMASPGDRQGEQQFGGLALPGRTTPQSRPMISPAVITVASAEYLDVCEPCPERCRGDIGAYLQFGGYVAGRIPLRARSMAWSELSAMPRV